MKKKTRKNQQQTLINSKGAGRPAMHDAGIRHRERPKLNKLSSLHLTIKIKKIKADLKNKSILKVLKRAICNARKKGLRVIHFSLEYDHVHLLIESPNNFNLGRGMQSLGVTLVRGINVYKKSSGRVYKHRYHFRKIQSSRELKIVMNYIFNNGVKHGTAKNVVNHYNSIGAELKYYLFMKGKLKLDQELMGLLDRGKVYFAGLGFVFSSAL
jgi:REP element-mobilizing transposase RayT